MQETTQFYNGFFVRRCGVGCDSLIYPSTLFIYVFPVMNGGRAFPCGHVTIRTNKTTTRTTTTDEKNVIR